MYFWSVARINRQLNKCLPNSNVCRKKMKWNLVQNLMITLIGMVDLEMSLEE